MRLVYLICYDITEPKRWRQVYKLMVGHGDWLQYSVFRCELSGRELATLIGRLSALIKHDEDQILFFPLGPREGLRDADIRAVGRPYVPRDKGPVIV